MANDTQTPLEAKPEDESPTSPTEGISTPPLADFAKEISKFASKTDEAWGVDRNQQVRRLGPRQPWMCSAHLSDGSGRLCTKAKAHGSEVCETHGAGSSLVKAKHQRELEAKLPTVSRVIDRVLDDDSNRQAQVAMIKEVHSMVYPRQVGEAGTGLVVNIGFVAPQPVDTTEVIDIEAEPQTED